LFCDEIGLQVGRHKNVMMERSGFKSKSFFHDIAPRDSKRITASAALLIALIFEILFVRLFPEKF
jgi:hypothetical protein